MVNEDEVTFTFKLDTSEFLTQDIVAGIRRIARDEAMRVMGLDPDAAVAYVSDC